MYKHNSFTDMLHYMIPSKNACHILVLNGAAMLRDLVSLCPKANFDVVTPFEGIEDLYDIKGYNIKWYIADIQTQKLTLNDQAYDIIIAPDVLDHAYIAWQTLLHINRLLKPAGFLITLFHNIRYHGVLENIRNGQFSSDTRFYAKQDIVNLLNDALYKEIHFLPSGADDKSDVLHWANDGFANQSNDLAVPVWIIKAQRLSSAVMNLKSMYTTDIRMTLARFLRRIEYGIDRNGNLDALWELCNKNHIFPEYLADFIRESLFHKDAVIPILISSAQNHEMNDYADELLAILDHGSE